MKNGKICWSLESNLELMQQYRASSYSRLIWILFCVSVQKSSCFRQGTEFTTLPRQRTPGQPCENSILVDVMPILFSTVNEVKWNTHFSVLFTPFHSFLKGARRLLRIGVRILVLDHQNMVLGESQQAMNIIKCP